MTNRILRFRDAPRYLGMDRNRFNTEVRPHLTEIPIGKQGIGFDRLELDAWVDEYVARNGRPAKVKGAIYMGRKRVPGLIMRSGKWHIDKRILGRRICRSTGTDQLEEAQRRLAKVMEECRQAGVYGVRPSHHFEEAAAKFILENQHKRSLRDDISRIKGLLPWIGGVPLDRVHMGTLQPWIEARRRSGVSIGTINHGLQVVRRILNLAAGEWVDDHGLTWLHSCAKIKLLPNRNKREPYPLTWQEQSHLFSGLPDHLASMALFAVNTGCRSAEVCGLRWEWEVDVPALGLSVFIIPNEQVKNGDERLVVLNSIAASVIQRQRGQDPQYVFTFRGKPVRHLLNTGWRSARRKAGLPHVRVHDLKHTFGQRLRAAGVTFEDRQDLLGHRSKRLTTHYSAAELSRLVRSANRVCEPDTTSPEVIVLRGALSRKTSATRLTWSG